jgi:hypothetical protein
MRPRLISALVVCLFILQAAWAQAPGEVSYSDSPTMPEGRRGERIRAVIDTLNSGSPERIREFISTECTERFRKMAPMDERINVFLQVYRETGGIEFSGIRTYVPERKGDTVVILKDRNFDGWRAFTIRFADPPDYVISGLGFNIARAPSGLVGPPLAEEQVVEETKALVARLIDKCVFSGALLIAKGDKVLLTMAGGEASKRFHVPNNIDTKFNLGSMTKMFT